MTKEICQTYEITGAILVAKIKENEEEALMNDATQFIKASGLELGDMQVNAVKNEKDTINIALPYYSGLTSNINLDDIDLEDVDGGEVFVVFPTVVSIALGLGAASVATSIAAVSYNLQDKNLDGSPK